MAIYISWKCPLLFAVYQFWNYMKLQSELILISHPWSVTTAPRVQECGTCLPGFRPLCKCPSFFSKGCLHYIIPTWRLLLTLPSIGSFGSKWLAYLTAVRGTWPVMCTKQHQGGNEKIKLIWSTRSIQSKMGNRTKTGKVKAANVMLTTSSTECWLVYKICLLAPYAQYT